MDFIEVLKPLEKSSIRIKYDENFTGECPLGASKIGGKPDLPPDFKWDYYHGEGYDGITANRPLSFIAQINCTEISEYDHEKLLPQKGMLYFFFEMATMHDIYHPKQRDGVKVYYYPCDIFELRRTDLPEDLSEEFIIPEMPCSFSQKTSLPDWEEFRDNNNIDIPWEKYNEAKKIICNENADEKDDRINKLLGYADLIQGQMLYSCAVTAAGVYAYGDNKAPEDKLNELRKNSTKWRLLFQLDYISVKDYEMLWGDCGRIYYYINMDDLVKHNFNNCVLELQCC